MAKGLQLIDTKIREFYMVVHDDGLDADVRILYEVYDDAGELVRSENYKGLFSEFATQVRASLNAAFRLISQKLNQDGVNENTITWSDL